MRRIDAYTQATPPMTRIELLVAAFDGIVTRIQQADDLMKRGQRIKADMLLCRAQRIVLELYSGVDIRYGEIPMNMKKLYLYVLGCIGMGRELDIPGAVSILGSIREGLQSIRDKAIDLERLGEITPLSNEARVLHNIVA